MLKEKINKFYERFGEEGRERDYFYISEVDKCKRMIYYKCKQAPRAPLEPAVARKYETGDYAHIRLMSTLYSLGIVNATEIKTPKGELFRGRADAIITLDGENYVVEIKSSHPYEFEQMEKPKPSAYKQLQLYLHYFDIEKGILLIECTGTRKLKEFHVEKDEKLIKGVLLDFNKLKEKIDSDKIPKPKKEKWEFNQCKYCPYTERCDQSSQ